MGTSSIYHGKNDRNPLLPDDYDGDQKKDDIHNISVKWKTVKSDMSKFISSGGHTGTVGHIAKQYIKASGGSSKMASQSTSGIHTGVGLGSFFSGIRTDGFATTFRKLGIEFSGRSVEDVFSQLINILATSSNTKEDIVAKEAAQEALSKVYDYVESTNLDLECLDKMSPNLMNEALCEYVGSYIWLLMMKDLGSRFEKYIDDPKLTLSLEQEFKDYIFSVVQVEFEYQGDVVNQDVSSSITNLYYKCLKVLEGTL